jgi:hypothetical protein
MTDDHADRGLAIDEVRADREQTIALLDAIDRSALETPGLGGGDWSAKDLIGHLESWERHALDAIDAWERGEASPIGIALDTLGTDEVNRREVERKAALPLEDVRSSADRTHRELLDAFASFDDTLWNATTDGDRTRGQQLGGILGGKRGLFRHDPDHWDELRSFAEEHPGSFAG